MIFAILAAQVAVLAPPQPQAGRSAPSDTATYSSQNVRALVADGARLNGVVPASFGRYHATLESEISYGARAGEREMAASVEQVSSTLSWARTGDFEQHIVGYRSQSLGPSFATIGFFRQAWAVPSLYGNRLNVLLGVDTTRRGGRGAPPIGRGGGGRGAPAGAPGNRPPSYVVVHPLANDREQYYRYSGGDTVEHLTVNNRDIRIVRIQVDLKPDLPPGTFFSGEVDLDVARKHIVRMRGSFMSSRRPPSGPFGLLRMAQLEGVIFVELVNAEVNQEYWLPSYQRFEAQAMAATMGDSKAVFRIVSTFRDYEITAPGPATGVASTDILRQRPHLLSLAPRDSLADFSAWHAEIGAASAALSVTDFDSLAPARWRPFGPPVVMLQTERLSDIARYNRVEGLYTGLGVAVRLRDLAPGVTVRAVAGYAWAERTPRGRLSAELTRGAWTNTIRLGRSLDITNDFRNPLDSGNVIAALFGRDAYDYVDRTTFGGSTTRVFGHNNWAMRGELGWARDRGEPVRVTNAPVGGKRFLANRGVDDGDYLRTALALRWRPEVLSESMRPGVGASLEYLRGDGGLNFQRVEFTANARINPGPWTFASRFDAGVVLGDVPPQQLLEIGRDQKLLGYEYKEFAGNQAAVLRGLVMFRTGLLRAPIRITERRLLPAPAPAFAVSLQAGWTGASDNGARNAMLRLGARALPDPSALSLYTPASTLTGNARTSVAAGIRFFGGSVGLMFARPLDHSAPWKFQLDMGQAF